MAWFRCGLQKTVPKSHTEDSDNSQGSGSITPTPPTPSKGRTAPDRLFSHPIVPLGSKNYLGQYYYAVPNYRIVSDDNINWRVEEDGAINAATSMHTTFIPALGTVFSTPGIQRVTLIYDYSANHNGVSYHVHREVSQDILVVNHGTVVEEATPDCPCDIYSDGYCFFRPIEIDSISYNSRKWSNGGSSTWTETLNYMHYYPKREQSVVINKVSCLPWYVYSLGTGYSDHNSGGGSQLWNTIVRDDETPAIYSQYTAFLTSDGVTPIDIGELMWASLSWLQRMDQLFYMVGSVVNYTAMSYWNVYGINFFQTFKDVGFSDAIFTEILSNWDTSSTFAMMSMFEHCTGIVGTSFLSLWDVGQVRDFTTCFKNCSNLIDLGGLSNWNVAGPYFTEMFSYCTSLVSVLPLLSWGNTYHGWVYHYDPARNAYYDDNGVAFGTANKRLNYQTGNERTLQSMFAHCSSLTSLNGLQNLTKERPTPSKQYESDVLEIADVIYDTSYMFENCISLTNISAISNWRAQELSGPWIYSSSWNSYYQRYDESGYRANGIRKIFSQCYNLQDISPLSSWNTSTWRAIDGMFEDCINLSDISALNGWDLTSCRFLLNVFSDCINLEDFSALSGWGSTTINLLGVGGMFSGCKVSSFSFLNTWNTSKLRSLKDFLYNVKFKFTDLSGLANLNVSKVKDFERCFYLASSRQSNLTYQTSIHCYAYTSDGDPNIYTRCYSSSYNMSQDTRLPVVDSWEGSKITSLNGIANWDISKAINLGGTFANNRYLIDISALSDWNTANVEIISDIFEDCQWLSDISALANWNTSKVTNMTSAFSNTSIANIMPLLNWDKSKVKFEKIYQSGGDYYYYINYATFMCKSFYRKAYSISLDKTILIMGGNTGTTHDPVRYISYSGVDIEGRSYNLSAEDVVFEGTKDASSASGWNFNIPADYDKPLQVFYVNDGIDQSPFSWNNTPSWD